MAKKCIYLLLFMLFFLKKAERGKFIFDGFVQINAFHIHHQSNYIRFFDNVNTYLSGEMLFFAKLHIPFTSEVYNK